MSLAISNTLSNAGYLAPLSPASQQPEYSILEKINEIVRYIKEKIWAFVKEAARLTISVLHFASDCEISDSVTGFPTTVANTAISLNRMITAIGLTSFITAVLNAIHILFKVEEAVDKSNIGDTEACAIASLDATCASLEVAYDIEVGLVALASLGAFTFDMSFCLVAIPCAIIPLIYQICKEVYYIFRNDQFIHSIPDFKSGDSIDMLKDYLDDRLGIPFSAKKISILERRSDEQIVKLMKKMRIHLNSDQVDLVKIENGWKHIKKYMWRKIAAEAFSTCVDTAMLVSLAASVLTPIPSLIVPVIGGIKSVLSFAKTGIYYLLNKWHKNNAPKFQKQL